MGFRDEMCRHLLGLKSALSRDRHEDDWEPWLIAKAHRDALVMLIEHPDWNEISPTDLSLVTVVVKTVSEYHDLFGMPLFSLQPAKVLRKRDESDKGFDKAADMMLDHVLSNLAPTPVEGTGNLKRGSWAHLDEPPLEKVQLRSRGPIEGTITQLKKWTGWSHRWLQNRNAKEVVWVQICHTTKYRIWFSSESDYAKTKAAFDAERKIAEERRRSPKTKTSGKGPFK
jgi:hypothetical protein